MKNDLVCIGGQEDGRRVTILHGTTVRFPKRRAVKTTDPWPADGATEVIKFVDYDVRLIHFDDGPPVEFLALREIPTARALTILLDAYAKPRVGSASNAEA